MKSGPLHSLLVILAILNVGCQSPIIDISGPSAEKAYIEFIPDIVQIVAIDTSEQYLEYKADGGTNKRVPLSKKILFITKPGINRFDLLSYGGNLTAEKYSICVDASQDLIYRVNVKLTYNQNLTGTRYIVHIDLPTVQPPTSMSP